jgi:muskelin
MFTEYITDCPYKPVWKKITTSETPSMRGGHQMCIDVDSATIYLFGGWDGNKDLADFWAFNCRSGMWTCISEDTRR